MFRLRFAPIMFCLILLIGCQRAHQDVKKTAGPVVIAASEVNDGKILKALQSSLNTNLDAEYDVLHAVKAPIGIRDSMHETFFVFYGQKSESAGLGMSIMTPIEAGKYQTRANIHFSFEDLQVLPPVIKELSQIPGIDVGYGVYGTFSHGTEEMIAVIESGGVGSFFEVYSLSGSNRDPNLILLAKLDSDSPQPVEYIERGGRLGFSLRAIYYRQDDNNISLPSGESCFFSYEAKTGRFEFLGALGK